MRRVKVIYLVREGRDPRWRQSFVEVFGDKHDSSIYNQSRPIEPQFADVEVVVDQGGASMTPALVAAAKKCKLWQIPTVGYDHFDMETMREAGIPVANVPGSTSAPGLAQCAMMFMIQIVTRYNEAQKTLKAARMYLPMGDELDGKRLGLIGFGASGQALARLAKAFGMKIMIIEPMEIEQKALREYEPVFVGKPDQMDKVIAEADFVSLHLPQTAETRGVIDARRIGLMKPTAGFINIARGDLVDQEALYRALLDGRLGGIGTDVHAGGSANPDHPVYEHPDFYALPHVAGTTVGTTIRRVECALQNVNRIAEGLEPQWRVDHL